MRSIIVTGASTGIGAATVRRLAKDRYRVFGTVRREADYPMVREAGATPVLLDVTDDSSVEFALAEITPRLDEDGLAALVNNAGVPCAGPIELVALDEVRNALEVNLLGVMRVTKAFLPLLRGAGGRIVNIGSVSGVIAPPFLGPYAATKFGLAGLTDSLRRELAGVGVSVTLIEAGSVATPIWDKIPELESLPVERTPYERVLGRFRERAVSGGRNGLPATVVARAIQRAVEAARPPVRVPVVSSPVRFRLLRSLPVRLVDSLIRRAVWSH